MPEDVIDLIHAAWTKIELQLLADPAQLAARIARRRLGLFRRAPRASCLALRACDLRILPHKHHMLPNRPEDRKGGRRYRRPHQIFFTANDLRHLCRPLVMPTPDASIQKTAQLLGVDPSVIHYLIKQGVFTTRRARGRMAIFRTYIYTQSLLDPASPSARQIQDFGWGTAWRYVADYIPDNFTATLTRIPKAIAAPNANPHAPSPGGNPLAGAGEGGGEGEFENDTDPGNSRSNPHPKTPRWRWLCPGCKRLVELLYCPMPGPQWVKFVNWKNTDSPDAVPLPISAFACKKCHSVHDYGRLDSRGWNDLITYLSAGLLRGRDVPRPSWWLTTRKSLYRPRPNRPRSQVRPKIENLLLHSTLSHGQIALKLQLPIGTIRGWVGQIYKQNNVHTRQALKERCQPPLL